MKPVSICIPAYGNEKGIRRLLESVEKQTYQPIEIVITDDSVGQEVEQLAVVFAQKLPIRYKRNSTRLGATANWNAAVDMALPESCYIKLMHHDDWFTFPDSLEKLVLMLEENSDCFMAFSASRQVPDGGQPYDRCTKTEDAGAFLKDYRNLFAVGNTIGAPSAVIIRKEEGMPAYDKQLKWIVDMDYYMSVLREHPRFVYTEEPLVSIGMSENQLTNACVDDKELMLREYMYVYQKYSLSDAACREKMAHVLVENGGSRKQAKALNIPAEYIRRELQKKRKRQLDSYWYALKRRIR